MSILSDEIAADPKLRGYSGMSHAEVAADGEIEYMDEVYSRFVTVRTLYSDLGPAKAHVIMTAIKGEATTNAPLARALPMMTYYGEGGGIDMGHAQTRTFIDALSGGALTAEQVGDLKGLASRKVSRWVYLKVGNVREGTVAQARAI